MKYLIILIMVVGLIGCEKKTNEISNNYQLPEELSDCKMYHLSDGISSLVAMRCPNSATSTTYKQGKSTKHTIVVDGVEYESKGE